MACVAGLSLADQWRAEGAGRRAPAGPLPKAEAGAIAGPWRAQRAALI